MSRSSFVALLLCALIASPFAVFAQEAKPKAKLAPADVEKLAPLYEKAMSSYSEDAADGGTAEITALKEAIDAYEAKNGVGSALADVDAWTAMFQSWYRSSFGKEPNGLGRVQKETIGYFHQSDVFLIEYAWYAPRNYDSSKAYPAILCFHDEGSSGDEYLDKVWLGDKDSKALAEDFILIAPTIGKKTASGKWEKQKATEEDYRWFNLRHLNAMIRPLKDVQAKLNVDPERIFVEGTGTGASIALQLGVLYGIESFAGIVARQGVLREPALVEGLENTPTLIVHRPPMARDEKEQQGRLGAHAEFRKLVEEKVSDVRTEEDRQDARSGPSAEGEQDAAAPQATDARFGTVTFHELPPPEKMTPKIEAGQAVEPVIDANPRIAAFYAQHRAIAYPERMHVVVNDRAFLSNSWFRISGHDAFSDDLKVLDALVEVDRENNTIKVTGKNLTKLALFLNDAIVDLDAPVKVTVNGIDAAHATLPRSLNTMLKYMYAKRLNTNRIVTAVTTVDVPEPEPVAPPVDPGATPADPEAAPSGDEEEGD